MYITKDRHLGFPEKKHFATTGAIFVLLERVGEALKIIQRFLYAL
jgi:hypothetical protein